jgi:tetratricopeptide (TPR) repeat protein
MPTPCNTAATIERACLMVKAGQEHAAIRLYEEGIRRSPCLEFYVNVGALYISVGRADMAVVPLEAAINVAPDCATAIINLGMAHKALGRDADAIACYRKALEFEPGNAEALKRLVALLEGLGRAEEAIRTIQQAADGCRTAEVLLQLGNLLMAAGRKQESADAFRQAVAQRSGYAEAHFNFAVAAAELHDLDQARSSCARAADFRPDQPLWRLRADLCGPVVFDSSQAIEQHCARVARTLEDWERAHPAPRKGEKRGQNYLSLDRTGASG